MFTRKIYFVDSLESIHSLDKLSVNDLNAFMRAHIGVKCVRFCTYFFNDVVKNLSLPFDNFATVRFPFC